MWNEYQNLIREYNVAFEDCMASIESVPNSENGGPANPHLISPPVEYKDSNLKVLYVGQETNGWEGAYKKSKGTDHLLKVYDDFANGGKAFKRGGQFWNAIKFFQNKFLELDSSSQFVWSNLIKVGKDHNKGRPCNTVLDWQKPWDPILKKEIFTFKPDVAIFFSGPNYDGLIKKHFPDIEFIPIGDYNIRELCGLKSKSLPRDSFRTYHPGYLYRFGLYGVHESILKTLNAY